MVFIFSKNTIHHANIPNITEIRSKHSSGCLSTLYQGQLDTITTMLEAIVGHNVHVRVLSVHI